jgi:hypothetical protein
VRESASLIVSLEQTPQTAIGVALRTEFPLSPSWLLAVEAQWLHAGTRKIRDAGTFALGLSSGWFDAVWVIYHAKPVEFVASAGVGLSILHASTVGVNGPGGEALRGAGRLGLGLNVLVDSRVALCGGFSAIAALNPVDYWSDSALLWRQPRLGGQFVLGFAIDFP